MKASQVVIALAEVASQGKYTVDPKGAKLINEVFAAAAELINQLEASEKEQEAKTPSEGEDNGS